MGILEINWIPILLVHIYLSPRFTQTDSLSLSQHRWPPYLSFPFLHTTPPDCWRYGLRHNGATCPVRYTCSVSQSLQWTHTHTETQARIRFKLTLCVFQACPCALSGEMNRHMNKLVHLTGILQLWHVPHRLHSAFHIFSSIHQLQKLNEKTQANVCVQVQYKCTQMWLIVINNWTQYSFWHCLN